MKVVRQRIRGQLAEQDGFRAVLLERQEGVEKPNLWLTYALVTMGKEEHILPGLVLDDWGNEIRSLALYEWIRENGDRFPRAEVFGTDAAGVALQLFVRALELHATYPTYVSYAGGEGPERVHAFILPDQSVPAPIRIAVPEDVVLPMREARVAWWRADPENLGSLDALVKRSEPGGDR